MLMSDADPTKRDREPREMMSSSPSLEASNADSFIKRLRAALLGGSTALKPAAQAAFVEEAIRQIIAELGGRRIHFPKTTQGRAGRPGIASEVRASVQTDHQAGVPNVAIQRRHGISRSTLYALIKRSPPSRSG